MKKLKFLPSILMLVLCVGVLAVGIYAIKPSTNLVTGTITINASNAPVEIQMIVTGAKGGTVTYDPVTVRGGTTFSMGIWCLIQKMPI